MLGIRNDKLSPCPPSPNCVCSDSKVERHHIKPYQLKVEPNKGWKIFKEVISTLPRTKIITVSNNYMRAEARSRIFRFVDDLEFQLRPQQKIIAVRSAARLGYYDFGVNRRRIGEIGKRLQACGVIQ